MAHPLVFRVGDAPAGAVYAGRNPSLGGAVLGEGGWGNPFPVGPGRTRERAIAQFRERLWELVREPGPTRDALVRLAHVPLACHCAPEPCHAEVLAKAASWASEAAS